MSYKYTVCSPSNPNMCTIVASNIPDMNEVVRILSRRLPVAVQYMRTSNCDASKTILLPFATLTVERYHSSYYGCFTDAWLKFDKATPKRVVEAIQEAVLEIWAETVEFTVLHKVEYDVSVYISVMPKLRMNAETEELELGGNILVLPKLDYVMWKITRKLKAKAPKALQLLNQLQQIL